MMNEKESRDLDETIDQLSREAPFKEVSEIGEVFGNLDNDNLNKDNLSNIDFNARLNRTEANSCIIIDELISQGILPRGVNITRQKKRLSVSLNGLGRQEKVEIASASRSADLTGRSGGVLGRLFSPRE